MNENYPIGSKVLIIKSGVHNNVYYNKGEVWTVAEHTRDIHIYSKRWEKTMVCVEPNGAYYGQECEPYIESEITNEYQIY